MTCDQFLARHSEYLDGLMDPLDGARWREHADDCAACGRYDSVVREGLRLVQSLPAVEASGDFEWRLRHRLLHLEDESWPPPRGSGGNSAVALVVAGVLAVIAWTPLLLREAVPLHIADLQRGGVGLFFPALLDTGGAGGAPSPLSGWGTRVWDTPEESPVWRSGAAGRAAESAWDSRLFGPLWAGRTNGRPPAQPGDPTSSFFFPSLLTTSLSAPGPFSPLLVGPPPFRPAEWLQRNAWASDTRAR
ncbi:MAG: hypothetical protein HY703_07505 [Gemmatimonadetes bacterium]|nr:hypothetical protein [Gemmatimonadota bacterium]